MVRHEHSKCVIHLRQKKNPLFWKQWAASTDCVAQVWCAPYGSHFWTGRHSNLSPHRLARLATVFPGFLHWHLLLKLCPSVQSFMRRRTTPRKSGSMTASPSITPFIPGHHLARDSHLASSQADERGLDKDGSSLWGQPGDKLPPGQEESPEPWSSPLDLSPNTGPSRGSSSQPPRRSWKTSFWTSSPLVPMWFLSL